MQKSLEQQRQEQIFVSAVGHRPHPRGANRSESDLHIAARMNLPVLVSSLLNQGADANAKGNEGETPLHVAAAVNAADVANVLLKAGADANAKTTATGRRCTWRRLRLLLGSRGYCSKQRPTSTPKMTRAERRYT